MLWGSPPLFPLPFPFPADEGGGMLGRPILPYLYA